jgi:hypothetical protein
MATNAPYKLGAEKIFKGLIDLTGSNIKAVLVSNAYTPNLTTDEFYSDISAHVLAGPVTLTTKTATLGTFDADDVTFPTVASGDTALGVAIYHDTGTAGTSQLLLWLPDITGFPLLTNGADIIAQFSSGPYKIWTIV